MRLHKLLLASVLAAGCGGMHCEPVEQARTGDLRVDVIGVWDDWGIDSHVVLEISGNGKARYVEEPNMYSPSGGSSQVTYTIDDAGGFTRPYQGTIPIEVTPTHLIEHPMDAQARFEHP